MSSITGHWSSAKPAAATTISAAALATLLLVSKLEKMFFASDAASAGLWEYSGAGNGYAKQSGATYQQGSTSGRDFSKGFGETGFDLTFQKHYDAITNLGIVVKLPGIIGKKADSSSDGVGGKVGDLIGESLFGIGNASGAVAGIQADIAHDVDVQNAIAFTQASGDKTMTSIQHTAGKNAQAAIKQVGTIVAGAGYAAYCPYAQYVVLDNIQFKINQMEVLSFSGVDLLVLTDVYGCGQKSLDVLESCHYSSNLLETRAGQSCTDVWHVISLSMWFERGSSFALHPSIDSGSVMEFTVKFKQSNKVIQKDQAATSVLHYTSTAAAEVPLTDAHLEAYWIYDAYHFSPTEKTLYTNWQADGVTKPYRKPKSVTSAYADPTTTSAAHLFQPAFIGSDIIMYATKNSDVAKNVYTKFGFGGPNDQSVAYLESAVVGHNANDSVKVTGATTVWNQMMGSNHIARLGALLVTPQPGFPLDNIAECNPMSTFPFARMEHVTVTPKFTSGLASSDSVQLNVLYTTYSALLAGNSTIGPMFHYFYLSKYIVFFTLHYKHSCTWQHAYFTV